MAEDWHVGEISPTLRFCRAWSTLLPRKGDVLHISLHVRLNVLELYLVVPPQGEQLEFCDTTNLLRDQDLSWL